MTLNFGMDIANEINPNPYILFRFPVVSMFLAVCHDLQLANLYWHLAERRSREFNICQAYRAVKVQTVIIMSQHKSTNLVEMP